MDNDDQARADGLFCPCCGRPLAVGLLEVPADDRGEPEILVLLDYPGGDFHGTVTRKAALALVTAEVVRWLRSSLSASLE